MAYENEALEAKLLEITLAKPDIKTAIIRNVRRGLGMIQCQGCGSEHVQKFSIVYDGGLSDINAKEAGMGLGIGAGGLGLGAGSSKIKGSHQSRLSQKAAPPEKKKVVKHRPIFDGVVLYRSRRGTCPFRYPIQPESLPRFIFALERFVSLPQVWKDVSRSEY